MRRAASLAAVIGLGSVTACAGLVGVGDVSFEDGGTAGDGGVAPDGSSGNPDAGGPADGGGSPDGSGFDGPGGDGPASDAPASDGPAATDSPTGSATPRPLAPLSTARTTTRRPTFHWALSAGFDAATIELCTDRACNSPIGLPQTVSGTSYTPSSNLPSGTLYWRMYPAGSTTQPSATWQVTIPGASVPVDASWGTTLDVNGDGYADIAVGCPVNEAAYVYLGSKTGSGSVLVLHTPHAAQGEGFGSSLASAGDVDGDGFADLVVGATASSGVAFVYKGGPSGVVDSPATTITGPMGANGIYGGAVASAGDVNGDGYADVVIGNSAISSNTGNAFVYLGGDGGLATSPSVTMVGPGGTGGNFGSSLGSIGDVDGDGFADVVVGAHSTGAAYVYYGSASGPKANPDVTVPPPQAGSDFGVSVSTAGDVNGDGYADLLVGATFATSSGGQVGAAYVFLGAKGGIAVSPFWTGLGSVASDAFGYSVAGAGDVNGDGYADVVVGDYGQNTYTGAAMVYFGSPTTMTGGGAVSGSAEQYTEFGYSVAGAGDTNGDGYADVLVGAFGGFDQPPTYPGEAFVFLGASTGLSSAPSPALMGPTAGSYFGFSVAGATE